MLLLLETDFKNLFLSGKNIRIKKKSGTFEKRVTGRGFGKSVFYLSEFNLGHPEQIKIKHPWLRLSIQLDKLKKTQTNMAELLHNFYKITYSEHINETDWAVQVMLNPQHAIYNGHFSTNNP